MATLMATLMVLLIFNLKGAGYAVILPHYGYPHWLFNCLGCRKYNFARLGFPVNISKTIEKSSCATLNYFDAVVEQYLQGKTDSIAYQRAHQFSA